MTAAALILAATLRWGATETAKVPLQATGERRSAAVTLQRVALDTASLTVHGMLIAVRDPASRVVWWNLLIDRKPIAFDITRKFDLGRFTFATDGERIAGFMIQMPNLIAGQSRLRARSYDEVRTMLASEIEESLRQSWPVTGKLSPSSRFVSIPLAEQTGDDFLRPLHPHETNPPVSIDSVSFDRGLWNVLLKNERGSRATLQLSPDLQVTGHARMVKQ